MSVASMLRAPTPLPQDELSVWWIGPDDPPAWLARAEAGVNTAVHAERLPLNGVDLAVLSADEPGWPASLTLLSQVANRCRSASAFIVIVPDLAAKAEVTLLNGGATLVLDAAVPPEVGAARFRAVLEHVRLRKTLRHSTDPLSNGEEDGLGRRLMALSFASRLLTTVQDEDEIFRRLVNIVARELSSARVSLMHVNRQAGVLEMRCAVGISRRVIRSARPRIGEGIAGTCAALGKPLFVDDHTRAWEGGGDLSEFVPEGGEFHNLPMSLTVPILVKGEVVGVVNVTGRVGNEPYSREDIAFISALMGQAGYLLENASLLAHLRELRSFSEKVINTISDPLVVLDCDLKVVHCNERFGQLFGAASHDNLWDCLAVDPPHRTALAEALLSPVDSQAVELDEWTLDEHVFEPSMTAFSDRERPRFLLFLRDATSRRQMERRLMSADKMASLGVLAAGVGHEINNPLSFVKSNAQQAASYVDDLVSLVQSWRQAALSGGEPGPLEKAQRLAEELDIAFLESDVKTMMKESIEGVERVEKIVIGLKSFAHPDTGKAYKTDVAELISNAALLTQGKWKYRLDLLRKLDEAPPIWCLPGQIEQVLMNLIVNAAQAAPDWGRLEISLTERDGGVEITFADDCGGIPPEIASHVFEPFFTTKDIGEGTGLGLSIAYNIIQSHGGTIDVDTQRGRGTTFRIYLPAGDKDRPLVVKQHSRYRF